MVIIINFIADLQSVLRWTKSKVEDVYQLRDIPELKTSGGIPHPQQSEVDIPKDLEGFAKVYIITTQCNNVRDCPLQSKMCESEQA